MTAILTDYPTIVTRFGYAPLAPSLWRRDPQSGLEFRDLSLQQASDGAFVGRHLRAGGLPHTTDSLLDAEAVFAFYIVLAGQASLHEEGGQTIVLGPLDSATRAGAGRPVSFTLSHGAELIEMKATASGASQFAPGDGRWSLSREAETAYVQGQGPRDYFYYRDLGVTDVTARRIHIHIVRATRALDGGTGWHSHSMGQLFYVLRGWADLNVEQQPSVRMQAGDAMCVPERKKHNVPAFSADYLVLEMCIPADYDTIDADPL